MNFLKSSTEFCTRALNTPTASPVFSTMPSGSYSMMRRTSVRSCDTGSKRTVPAFGAPETLRHAITWSGTCSVISASHSLSLPQTSACQCTWVSSSCFTSFTPAMKRGNSSNWVHWL